MKRLISALALATVLLFGVSASGMAADEANVIAVIVPPDDGFTQCRRSCWATRDMCAAKCRIDWVALSNQLDCERVCDASLSGCLAGCY